MNYDSQTAERIALAFEDEMRKIAQTKQALSVGTAKTLGLLGAGAVGAEALRRAERDRRLGRTVRMQQGQGY